MKPVDDNGGPQMNQSHITLEDLIKCAKELKIPHQRLVRAVLCSVRFSTSEAWNGGFMQFERSDICYSTLDLIERWTSRKVTKRSVSAACEEVRGLYDSLRNAEANMPYSCGCSVVGSVFYLSESVSKVDSLIFAANASRSVLTKVGHRQRRQFAGGTRSPADMIVMRTITENLIEFGFPNVVVM